MPLFRRQILWSTTGVRKQDLQFPDYDLLNEIDSRELGILLRKFRKGEIAASSPGQFRSVFERFCERYNAHPSHSMGKFPFDAHWNFAEGWKMKQPPPSNRENTV
jgi:hypothetical protein